ncbi:MAG: hypothetical protein KH441_12965 [Clostridium sp.]|nr:hypothetical protein [Clostridium sp.]
MKNVVLSNEDFQDFPIGEFPYDKDHTAMGEYQYVVENGYHGNWVDMVCNYTYNGTGPTWLITERDGRHFIESMRIEKNRPHRMFPTLEIGKHQWKDYEVSASIKRLSQKGMAGLVFSMNHSIDTLVFYLDGKDKAAVAYRHKEKVRVLKEVSFPHGCDQEYRLKVDCDGRTARVYVDDQELFWVEDDLVARGGKVGITADCPSRFADFKVCISEKTKQEINMAKLAVKETETEEMKKHPKMKLWKKIDLKNFGTSRQIRFGHLTGTDEWYVVLAQMQKRVSRDSYGFISCLTAIDLEGNVLWQLGEPSDKTEELGKVSADMAFQIYDIDGDGKDEVIVGWDFEIRILDGETGTIKKSAKTPFSDDDDSELIGVPYQIYAFERINPDGIRICNFRGKEKPADILIKDRYCRIYALDEDLNLMWKFKSPTNTGHCPLPIDIDGDGKDELLVGYNLLDSDGQLLWSYPISEDHTDEIVAGKWMPGEDEGHFACVSGTEGFFIGDFYGNIVARDMIGHAQRVSIANYCPEREGREIVVTNFWGHQGVIFLYDCYGNQIWEMENEMNGNILSPVNWDGDGTELILTNADAEKGGLLNGRGIRAVEFPDDGHPVLCCESLDLTGDERDELVVWDYYSMYIYTQDDCPKEQNYHPVQFPIYNASNYRGEYSYPDASYLDFHADKEKMKDNRK